MPLLRGHFGDIGDLAEMTFEWLGDAGGHRFRTGAGKLRADRDGRIVDLRQRRDRQFQERENAGQCDAEREQRRRHRPADEWRGNVHSAGASGTIGVAGPAAGQTHRQAVEIKVDDRRGEQREHLADDQAADNGDAERLAQFGAGSGTEHQRHGAEDRGHRGHHDRPEAQQAGLVDRVTRRQALDALGLQGEVDHHDGVFLDDADQQNDADDGDDVEVVAQQHQRQ